MTASTSTADLIKVHFSCFCKVFEVYLTSKEFDALLAASQRQKTHMEMEGLRGQVADLTAALKRSEEFQKEILLRAPQQKEVFSSKSDMTRAHEEFLRDTARKSIF